MIKERKFRVWIKERKTWAYFSLTRLARDSKMQYYVQNSENIVQSTGLFDKNGIEIFENDIVKDNQDELQLVKYGFQNVDAFIGVGFNLFPFKDGPDYKEKYGQKESALRQLEIAPNILKF